MNTNINDLKVTSKDDDRAVYKKVKSKINLKRGDPDDINHSNGRDLKAQAFGPIKTVDLQKFQKKQDANIQNEFSQTIAKNNKESFSTKSQFGQRALYQSKVFKQAKNLMGETISDMDREFGQKDNKLQFLEVKKGIPDCRVTEEMNRIDLIKISSKEKNDRFLNRLNRTAKNHKYSKN